MRTSTYDREMKHSVWLVTLWAVGVASANPQAKPPHGAMHIAIDYTWQSFSKDEAHYKLDWNGTTYTVGKRKVDAKLIDALYASLTGLHDASDPLRCISHTDDYPAFVVAIDGDEPLKIESQSNCHAYVPWNVTRAGKLQAQFSGDIWHALSPILAASADRWKTGGNSPIATTAFGGEMVGLGEFQRGSNVVGNADAGKCVHDLETSADARKLFGEVHVDGLQARLRSLREPGMHRGRGRGHVHVARSARTDRPAVHERQDLAAGGVDRGLRGGRHVPAQQAGAHDGQALEGSAAAVEQRRVEHRGQH